MAIEVGSRAWFMMEERRALREAAAPRDDVEQAGGSPGTLREALCALRDSQLEMASVMREAAVLLRRLYW